MIINTPNINEVRKQIQKIRKENEKEEIIIIAQDTVFNRKILEMKEVDIILGLERHSRKDKLKQRDSGLNEVLCKLAKENNIKIGIDIDALKKLNKKDKAKIISRIIQNISLCNKIGSQIIIFPKGKYNKLDVQAFLISLGSSTQMARSAV